MPKRKNKIDTDLHVVTYLRYGSHSRLEKCAIYARTNRVDKPISDVLDHLRNKCHDTGLPIVCEYKEENVIGTSPISERPEIEKLLEGARTGAFNVLAIVGYEALTRNGVELHQLIETLESAGVMIRLFPRD